MATQTNGNPGIAMVNESTSAQTKATAQTPTQIEIAISDESNTQIVDKTLTYDEEKSVSESLQLSPGTYSIKKFLAKKR